MEGTDLFHVDVGSTAVPIVRSQCSVTTCGCMVKHGSKTPSDAGNVALRVSIVPQMSACTYDENLPCVCHGRPFVSAVVCSVVRSLPP